ncbi:MAG: flagellar protein FliT [Lysobacterales bacterium]
MNYEQAELELAALSGAMLEAADQQNWERVAELHDSMQNQLQVLFSSEALPADDRPARLLEGIQQLGNALSFQARSARKACAQQLDRTQQKRRGMAMYQETAAG